MNDAERQGSAGSPAGLLSGGELSARRAAARRRRARGRLGAASALGTGLIVLAMIGFAELGSGRRGTEAVLATPRPRAITRLPRSVRRHANGAALAIGRVLAYTSYVSLAGHRRPDVALTFDDGPGPYTPQILRILRRTHTPATFFGIGRSARAFPRLVAQEARDGYQIGDHTEIHPMLSLLSPSAQAAQIAEAAIAIRAAGAPSPRLFRPPYGSFDQATLRILHAKRMLMVLWSADTKDYSRPGVARIVYTAVSGAKPGAILLMHDGGGDRSETVAALPRIIRRLRQRGFRLVTVARLLAEDPPPRDQPPPQPLTGRF